VAADRRSLDRTAGPATLAGMRILMVCLGNICRSPMAAAVLRHLAAAHPGARGWTIDSAGTGAWHVGKPADPRTAAVLRRHGVDSGHCARQVRPGDFRAYDRLVAMDRQNLAELGLRRPRDASAVVELLGDYDPLGVAEVPDPYYGGDEGFDGVYAQVRRCGEAFIARHAG
jgi:protein-tyrosine phosphatase